MMVAPPQHLGAIQAERGGTMGSSAQNDDGDHKVLVCHATSSATNRYVGVVVDIASTGGLNKLMGHMRHVTHPNKKNGPDYIFPF